MTSPMTDNTGPQSQRHAATALPGRGVVQIAGPDAIAFLDKLATNDLDGMASGDARFAALLSPQGKVLFEFLAVRPPDDSDPDDSDPSDASDLAASVRGGLLLDIAREMAEPLVKRLTLYKLRAKVEIADVSGEYAVVIAAGSHGSSFDDPRHTALPRRAFVPTATVVADNAASNYEIRDSHDAARIAARIAARVPEMGRDYASGDLVAHEALLDRLSGVSFTKGCYVGQEIVARMEHRGTARKRFVRITAAALLPPMGTEVRAGEALIGVIGSSVPRDNGASLGLALLRLDRLAEFEAKGIALTAGGVTIVPDAADVADLMPKAPDPIALD